MVTAEKMKAALRQLSPSYNAEGVFGCSDTSAHGGEWWVKWGYWDHVCAACLAELLVEPDDGMVYLERAAAETAAMLIRAQLAQFAGLRLKDPTRRDLDKACADGMDLLGVFEAALKVGGQ